VVFINEELEEFVCWNSFAQLANKMIIVRL